MKIANKNAHRDFELFETVEAGINLTGPEVKAVRLGYADLTGSFVKIIGSEAYLVNAKIFPYRFARLEGYDERRTRKLLLHKKEILALKSKIEGANLTIVPILVYNSGHLIKVQLAVGKGKKQYQKKDALKRRDLDRQIEEELSRRSP